ncbi:metallophosphoesterase [Bacillus cihuensis]|uniref:metallophosphoesterase n=1 Tax=Bacillus cihuensis TaxID=1208599 RepID=UPI0004288567|nr:metallophosphoesterase [Bacillus cihuensis]
MNNNMTRRSFLKKTVSTLLTLTGAGIGGKYYAHDIEPNWIEFNEIVIQHPLIPKGFNGMKIVQFSDTHLGFQFQLKELQSVLTKIQTFSPDVVLFTGDLMDEPNKYPHHSKIIPLLQNIQAPLGKFSIYGNHDHGGYGSKMYNQIMERSGFTLLQNSHAAISLINGDKLYIAGIDDAMLGSPNIQKALLGIPEKAYTILLSHAPDLAEFAKDYPVQYQISGHSHAGQIQVPFAGALVTPPFGKKYIEGLYELENLTLYVNRGLGTTRLPYRFLARPEITLFELQSNENQ